MLVSWDDQFTFQNPKNPVYFFGDFWMRGKKTVIAIDF